MYHTERLGIPLGANTLIFTLDKIIELQLFLLTYKSLHHKNVYQSLLNNFQTQFQHSLNKFSTRVVFCKKKYFRQ